MPSVRENAVKAHMTSPMNPPLIANAMRANPVPASATRSQVADAVDAWQRTVDQVRRREAEEHARGADQRVEDVVVARAEDDREHDDRIEQRNPRQRRPRSQPQQARDDEDGVAEVQADCRRSLVAKRARMGRWAVRERHARDPVRRGERVEREDGERRDVQQDDTPSAAWDSGSGRAGARWP